MMMLPLLPLLLLLLELLLLLLMVFRELDEMLFLGVTLEPNMLFNLFDGCVDEEIDDGELVDSITCTKFEGNTPILPFNLPLHQPNI